MERRHMDWIERAMVICVLLLFLAVALVFFMIFGCDSDYSTRYYVAGTSCGKMTSGPTFTECDDGKAYYAPTEYMVHHYMSGSTTTTVRSTESEMTAEFLPEATPLRGRACMDFKKATIFRLQILSTKIFYY